MKLKSIAAILVAGIMVVSLPMVAMADTHWHNGSDCTGHTDVPDVTSSYGTMGVYVVGTDVECNVGKVNSESVNAIQAKSNAKVTAESANNNTTYDATAYAGDGAEVDVKNEVTNAGSGYAVYAEKGATITAGSATSGQEGSNGYATVFASGKDATVTVNGAVTNKGKGSAINASSGATVIAGSATNTGDGSNTQTIVASGTDTIVVVSGAVTNNGDNGAIKAKDGASVLVGSAISNGIAIEAEGKETKVGVHGDVSSKNSFAVKVSNGADVVVEGNADGTYGVGINNSNANEENSVVVLGTINASKHGVVVMDGKANNYEVYAYEIKAPEGNMFVDNRGKADETIAQHVYYIVKTGKDSLGSVNALIDSKGEFSSFEDEKTGISYNLAKEGNQADASTGYIVKVSEVPGYQFKSMSTTNANAVLQQNADGTYTLFVPRGGGVTIDLVYEAIQQAQSSGGSSSWSSAPTVKGSASAPISNGTWTNVNGAFRYEVNGETLKNAKAWITYVPAGQTTLVTGCFYFDRNGSMQTGWQKIDEVWYYFNTAQGPTYGMMLTNTTTPDGYVVDADGKYVK